MPDPSTFGDLLRDRCRALRLQTPSGAASAELLAAFLDAHGVKATERGVTAWFFGERVPRIGRMENVLDALGVHGELRLLAYRLAARVEQADPIEPHDDLPPASSPGGV